MKGHKFLKVTGILMIIASIATIGLGAVAGVIAAMAAGVGVAGHLPARFYLVLLATLGGGICQLIAGIQGIRHSKKSEKATSLIVWGAIVMAFSVLGIVLDVTNGDGVNILSILTGLAVPVLYIVGAVLNAKADDTQAV